MKFIKIISLSLAKNLSSNWNNKEKSFFDYGANSIGLIKKANVIKQSTRWMKQIELVKK